MCYKTADSVYHTAVHKLKNIIEINERKPIEIIMYPKKLYEKQYMKTEKKTQN